MELHSEREEKEAYQVALHYLAARSRTIAEMEARLRRSFDGAAVEAVTARLVRQGLLDDQAFARQWREIRQRVRPRSAALLRYEMVQRGVPRDLAEEVAAGLDDEALAYQAALRFARHLAGVEAATFQRRLGQHLYRRGFAHGVVRRTVALLWQERHQAAVAQEQVGHLEEDEGR
jgi:regulatory protein